MNEIDLSGAYYVVATAALVFVSFDAFSSWLERRAAAEAKRAIAASRARLAAVDGVAAVAGPSSARPEEPDARVAAETENSDAG